MSDSVEFDPDETGPYIPRASRPHRVPADRRGAFPHLAVAPRPSRLHRLLPALYCLGMLGIGGVTGAVFGWSWREPPAAKTTPDPPRVEKNTSPSEHLSRTERTEVERLTLERAYTAISDGWRGVLKIEDGNALTVANNRAALGSGEGFTVLPPGDYLVIAYTRDRDRNEGVGLAGDLHYGCFPFVWKRGLAKDSVPPPKTIRALRITSGRRVTAVEP